MTTRRAREAGRILGQHIGHRLLGVDDTSVRCVDCCHLLLLDGYGRPGTAVADGPSPARPDAPDRCPLHVGELASWCRPCAAERKGRPDDAVPEQRHRPAADVAAGVAACRAALAAARSRRG